MQNYKKNVTRQSVAAFFSVPRDQNDRKQNDRGETLPDYDSFSRLKNAGATANGNRASIAFCGAETQVVEQNDFVFVIFVTKCGFSHFLKLFISLISEIFS